MRTKKIKNIALLGILFLVALFTYTCEEISEPSWNNGDNISLKIKGTYTEIVNGEESQPMLAKGATIVILHTNIDKGIVDTLTYDVAELGSNGEFVTEIQNSKNGISNLKVYATYMSKQRLDSLGFICCDTALTFNWQIENNKKDTVNCSNLGLPVTLTLGSTNQGGCLSLNTVSNNIKGNTYSWESKEKISIDLTPIKNLVQKGKFTASSSIQIGSDGKVEINKDLPLALTFYVDTKTAGIFDTTIVLLTKCLESGSTQTGNITINLNAEVCAADVCNCPFVDKTQLLKMFNETSNLILVNNEFTFNESIIPVETGVLQEGCYMKITDVVRYPDTLVSASDIPSGKENLYDWTVVTTTPGKNQQLNIGSLLSISAKFKPENTSESADTFRVSVDVYNKDNVKNENKCSFLVAFKGLGCDYYCPSLIINNFDKASRIPGNSKLNKGDTLEFENTPNLKQEMVGYISTSCNVLSDLARTKYLEYVIFINDKERLQMCKNVRIEFRKSTSGNQKDLNCFSTWHNTYLNISTGISSWDGTPTSVGINFAPPLLADRLNETDNIYNCNFIISAYGQLPNGNEFEICSETIEVVAKAEQTNVANTPIRTMLTFSQISDKSSNPSYIVYNINNTNNAKELGFEEMKSNQVRVSGGNIFPTNTEASFFFDVDSPNDISIANQQYPKLYLINSIENSFSYITAKPVASGLTRDQFIAEQKNLVKKVFNKSGFTSTDGISFQYDDLGGPEWKPNITKDKFIGRKGIILKPGEVYIIWDKASSLVDGILPSQVYGGYCRVAFLHISSVNHNKDVMNMDQIGTVSFTVAYPISIEK